MYVAQYLHRDTITRILGPRPTTRICRSHSPGLSSKKKKEKKGEIEKK